MGHWAFQNYTILEDNWQNECAWVGLGRVEPMGWTIFFITIIIKLSRKNININILKKPKD